MFDKQISYLEKRRQNKLEDSFREAIELEAYYLEKSEVLKGLFKRSTEVTNGQKLIDNLENYSGLYRRYQMRRIELAKLLDPKDSSNIIQGAIEIPIPS